MSKKFSERRREAFLRAVRESGNQTLAAERARVSYAWVKHRRKVEPDFDRAVRDAVAAAREALRGAAEATPPAGWGSSNGTTIVLRGSRGRRVQLQRARPREFCAAAEMRFLVRLRATCNVQAACAAAGLGYGAAYRHRKRWPEFGRRWDAALEEGYVRLEFALLLNARNSLSPADERLEPEVEMPPMSVWGAMHLLHMHQRRVRGTGGRPGARETRPPDMEKVQAKVVAALGAVKRMRALAGDEAVDRALAERRARRGA